MKIFTSKHNSDTVLVLKKRELEHLIGICQRVGGCRIAYDICFLEPSDDIDPHFVVRDGAIYYEPVK